MPNENEQKKTCFIIMPITTPIALHERYRDGVAHFKHVLECLFIPSVEKANFKPIRPTAEGTDLIQAKIIENLEKSDLVLCDMTSLNPNVFFEFGIRTSLNKPVCIVKDEFMDKVPFDTSILNYYEYRSSLDPWEIKAQIEDLSEHLITSYNRSGGENNLWKYFGFKFEASSYKGGTGVEAKLDYLMMKMDIFEREKNEQSQIEDNRDLISSTYSRKVNKISEFLQRNIPESVTIDNVVRLEDGSYLITYSGDFPIELKSELSQVMNSFFKDRVRFQGFK